MGGALLVSAVGTIHRSYILTTLSRLLRLEQVAAVNLSKQLYDKYQSMRYLADIGMLPLILYFFITYFVVWDVKSCIKCYYVNTEQ